MDATGTLAAVEQARTLSEAQRRAQELRADLTTRGVHPDVLRFCREELLADKGARLLTTNLAKIFDRWPQERTYPPLFDEGFPEYEHLPRSHRIEVFARDVGNQHYVFQRCNGINMGGPLTDNIMTPDDYRFHDVFHYAYAAILSIGSFCASACLSSSR